MCTSVWKCYNGRGIHVVVPAALAMETAISRSADDMTSYWAGCRLVQCIAISERRRSRFCIACRQSRHDISAIHARLTATDDACRVKVSAAVRRRNHNSNLRSLSTLLSPTFAVRPISDVYTDTHRHTDRQTNRHTQAQTHTQCPAQLGLLRSYENQLWC